MMVEIVLGFIMGISIILLTYREAGEAPIFVIIGIIPIIYSIFALSNVRGCSCGSGCDEFGRIIVNSSKVNKNALDYKIMERSEGHTAEMFYSLDQLKYLRKNIKEVDSLFEEYHVHCTAPIVKISRRNWECGNGTLLNNTNDLPAIRFVLEEYTKYKNEEKLN